jgi:succinoglycan biosynthesis protein ExoO
MPDPAVSVVVPAYNVGAYLREAVESALNQTEPSVEVVVVDDRSTDDTLAVAESVDDPRVRVLANEENRGPSHSRNRAIRAARGEWVAVLDADDWYAPDRLARLLAVARETGADLVADDQYLIRDGETEPFTSQFRTAGTALPDRLVVDADAFVRTNRPGHRSLRLGAAKALTRRAFLAEHDLAYDEDVWFCEDFRLYLACLLRGARFVVVDEPLYYRRQRGGSITAGDVEELLRHDIAASEDLLADPAVRARPDVGAALRARLRGARGHLAFRVLERAVRRGDVGGLVRQLGRRPSGVGFLAGRVAGRLRGR